MVEEDGRTEESPPPGPSSTFTLKTSPVGATAGPDSTTAWRMTVSRV